MKVRQAVGCKLHKCGLGFCDVGDEEALEIGELVVVVLVDVEA
jgi:hypothetical protein